MSVSAYECSVYEGQITLPQTDVLGQVVVEKKFISLVKWYVD
jgi:hypothetical protein